MNSMQWIAVEAIKPNPRNARTHSKKQIRQIADNITAFGFLAPILIDDGGMVIAGHGRYRAAILLGLREVPVIRVEGLSDAKRRALALADNKIAENAGWNRELLARELPELADILVVEGLDISITGFAPVKNKPGKSDQTHNDKEKPYRVGYGRPPASARFKPGISGNPNGRRKKAPSFAEVTERVLNEKIELRVGDRLLRMSNRDALVRSAIRQALAGRPKLLTVLPAIMRYESKACRVAPMQISAWLQKMKPFLLISWHDTGAPKIPSQEAIVAAVDTNAAVASPLPASRHALFRAAVRTDLYTFVQAAFPIVGRDEVGRLSKRRNADLQQEIRKHVQNVIERNRPNDRHR